jgi:hypothetical protein
MNLSKEMPPTSDTKFGKLLKSTTPFSRHVQEDAPIHAEALNEAIQQFGSTRHFFGKRSPCT